MVSYELESPDAILGPPAHTHYEAGLLGAVLEGGADLAELARIIEPADFHEPRHAEIFRAAMALDREGTKPTVLTVYAKLGSQAEKLGGAPYLHSLLSARTFSADDPAWLAEQMREQRIRRDIGDMGRRMRQVETDLDLNPDREVARVREWADSIQTVTRPAVEGVDEALQELMDIAQFGATASVPTPWLDINELIGGGLRPGQLVFVGARPNVGKSLFLENLATHIARRGNRVLYCSMEMGKTEILQRTMAHTAKVELSKLIKGAEALSEFDWQEIHRAYPILQTAPIDFVDDARQTLDSIRASAVESGRRARLAGQRFTTICIDYLQLLSVGRHASEKRQQEIGSFTRGLKILAGEQGVSVVVAAQLNRAPTNRSSGLPTLADFREADDPALDADLAFLLHEQEVEDGGRLLKTGDMDVIIAKQRNGPLGTRSLKKVGHYAKLTDA